MIIRRKNTLVSGFEFSVAESSNLSVDEKRRNNEKIKHLHSRQQEATKEWVEDWKNKNPKGLTE